MAKNWAVPGSVNTSSLVRPWARYITPSASLSNRTA
ncbi:Uncharacterised protein [Bordetella pertussis]|nr:Uncharacterised protein [Bordetella pertussis]